MSQRTKRLTLNVSEEEYENIKQVAEQLDIPIALFVRRCVLEKVDEEKSKVLEEILKKGGDNFKYLGKVKVADYVEREEFEQLKKRMAEIEKKIKSF